MPQLIRQTHQNILDEKLGDRLWSLCPVALILVDAEGECTVNPTASKLLTERVGDRAATWKRWAAGVLARLQGTGTEQTVLAGRSPSERPLKVSCVPVQESELSLLTLEETSGEAGAGEDLAETVSTLSHELRTPLAAIKSALNLVVGQDTGPLNEDQEHFLGMALRNIDRLDRLVTDLLDVSRADAGQLNLRRQNLDVGQLVQDTVEGYRQQAVTAGLTLEYLGGAETVLGQIDGDKLVQMVANLLGNALKYTPRGGTVQVQVIHELGPAAVVIQVKDNGPGMDPETRKTALDPYRRGQDADMSSVPGTGLGLHITGKLARAHGGTLGLDSRLGQGTCAWIRLPLGGDGAESQDREDPVFGQ
nr:HAMP domain-containing sensor histidine kinase [Candidatus Krumholzibacteria bacterium]